MPRDAPVHNGQIFLSYSRSDREACIALRSALEQAGLSIFQDETGIRVGDRWVTRLQEALTACSAFVVLIGRDGVERWVGAEVEIALTRHLSPHDDAERLPIFPVLLEQDARPEALPPLLAVFQSTRWSPAEPLPSDLVEAIAARVTRIDYDVREAEKFDGWPFPGLRAFNRADARLFFGRRLETLQALARLGDQRGSNPEGMRASGGEGYKRWLQIEGNSGAGKSSLVNSGMLPMIEKGALWARTGFERWKILGAMMPDKDPMAKLAEVLEHALITDPERRDSLALQQRLEKDKRALASRLKDFKEDKTAFLLVVDQFEELFTFADEMPRGRFDASLAYALQDSECPLFLISTVRLDFLDRFERVPRLLAIYNSDRGEHYILPIISEHGMREVIEGPARLAKLDVSEVTTAILEDARDEIGALPLVENALLTLCKNREPNSRKLSGKWYSDHGGITGILRAEADALLERIDGAVPKGGKRGALELLLRLTRINDEGRHSRQRITREEAVDVAGEGKEAVGERVVQLLSGERQLGVAGGSHNGALRLITTSTEKTSSNEKKCDPLAPIAAGTGTDAAKTSGNEKGTQYVDLIHETLIRARGKDEKTGKRFGYWPTLYDYIEANRDRDIHRQQLKFQTELWGKGKGLSRWWNLAGWRDLRLYQRLCIRKDSQEGYFLFWSRWKVRAQATLVLALLAIWGESAWWATQNSLPFGYVFIKPLWALGLYKPLPDMVVIREGTFTMGCVKGRDDVEGKCDEGETPAHEVTIARPFAMGKHEVTFLQYDYYVWNQPRQANTTVVYPSDDGWGRFRRPVINVSWDDAQAYASWLRDKTSKQYRLPTEAEWEYTARAGTDKAYGRVGKLGKEDANCDVSGSQWGGKMTAPVESFPANPWGLYDTAGNVFEWVEDTRHDTYQGAPRNGSAWESEEKGSRVLRGGSWNGLPRYCRAANRANLTPAGRSNSLGFRVCCAAPIE